LDDRHQELPRAVYTRIAHTFTQKNGWRHETTVSVTSNADDPIDHAELIGLYLNRADDAGRAESKRRNAIDGWEAPQ
jgi:hypothetical protein